MVTLEYFYYLIRDKVDILFWNKSAVMWHCMYVALAVFLTTFFSKVHKYNVVKVLVLAYKCS